MNASQTPWRPSARWMIHAPLLVLITLTLGLRLGFAEYVMRSGFERFPDTHLYLEYARRLFAGSTYEVNGNYALRMPGYPAFLALIWSLIGQESQRAVLWAQAAMGTLTVFFVWLIGRGWERSGAPTGTAFASAVLVSFEPFGLVIGGLELSETLFTTLLVAGVWSLQTLWHTRHHVFAALAGVLFAGSVFVRPSGLLLGPLLVMASALPCPRKSIVILWAAALFLVTLAPWWIRNARVFGSPVVTTLTMGESLYDGLNPAATGASAMSFKKEPATAHLSEKEEDQFWRQKAIQYAVQQPLSVFRLALVKLARFWSPWPNEERYRRIPSVFWGTAIPSILIFALAVVGLAATIRRDSSTAPLSWLILICAAYFCLIHMIFVSSVRYRVVVMPLVCLWAGAGFAAIYGLRAARARLEGAVH